MSNEIKKYIEEIVRLKRENEKKWNLIEELEKENTLLGNSVKNAYSAMNKKYETHIKSLEKKNKKLSLDNEFLRKIAISQNSIDKNTLKKFLGEHRALNN